MCLDVGTRDTVFVAHGGVVSMDVWQGRVLIIEGRSYRWV